MNITICGGGHLGHVCAGVFSSCGHNVSILSGHPLKWSNEICVKDSEGKVYAGSLMKVTNDPSEIIPNSDLVLLCLPGYLIANTLEEIKPYLKTNTIVGSIVSSTGFFFEAHKILTPSTPIFGFQRVPFISRLEEYGKSASLLGYKKELFVAVENIDPVKLKQDLQSLFLTPVSILNSYYEAALTNSNPLLHTSRLYTMWKDWDGMPYNSQSEFYHDWTDEASEKLIAMDNEFMKLLTKLGVKEGAIPSILKYYESNNSRELTAKIKSIPAFKSIKSPMKKVDNGWIPDFSSRYFTEDFPYGLRYIRDLAHKHNLFIPNIDEVYNWWVNKCIHN